MLYEMASGYKLNGVVLNGPRLKEIIIKPRRAIILMEPPVDLPFSYKTLSQPSNKTFPASHMKPVNIRAINLSSQPFDIKARIP